MTRRRPRWGDIAPLLGSPDRSRTALQRRLDRCASIGDLRALARRRVPVPVFDSVDGAAGTESTLVRSRAAFARVEFTPRVLRDVSEVDLSTTMLGSTSALPFAFAPTGFTRMMHHRRELAVAEPAGEAGIPYALSTLGTTSIEVLAAAAPDTRRWFQLYVWRDRAASEALVRRAADRGYDTLILTVDTAVGGIRRRDVRHGLTIPPQLSARTLAQMAMRPRWRADVLTTEPLEVATLTSTCGTVGELLTRVFDGSMTRADIDWLRGTWPGRLMVKGVQSVDDARLLAEAGVDAIVLSNHGGRQVDRGNVPLELLPQVAAEVGGRVEVYLDGGITSGADIVAALAFGATGTLVGRAYLYGLMAGGADGVRRAVEILATEVRTTMQLIGVRSVAELGSSYVRLRD